MLDVATCAVSDHTPARGFERVCALTRGRWDWCACVALRNDSTQIDLALPVSCYDDGRGRTECAGAICTSNTAMLGVRPIGVSEDFFRDARPIERRIS